MADAKQVKIRRDTAANLITTTPVEAELAYDQTNKRIGIGDGSTLGGTPHVNYMDARNLVFNRGSVGGTGNAITLTMNPAITSYQVGMKVSFIAGASNTGSTTINVDGVGNRNILKMSSGTLSVLSSGDIISGGYYEIIYNGTSFQLSTIYSAGIVSVSQGNLNTSTGTFSSAIASGGLARVGFSNDAYYSFGYISSVYGVGYTTTGLVSQTYAGASVATPGGEYGFAIQAYSSISSATTVFGRQRYITASPPYNMGDGEVAGFFFALVDDKGDIVSHYCSDTPPWAYNGPTDIRAHRICPVTNKKFRRVTKKRTLEEIMDGAKISYKEEEITDDIKNADMNLIPSPFFNVPSGQKIVLLDPMDEKIRRIVDFQNAGGGNEVCDSLAAGKFIIDNSSCKRCGPKGIKIHKMKYKYTGKF